MGLRSAGVIIPFFRKRIQPFFIYSTEADIVGYPLISYKQLEKLLQEFCKTFFREIGEEAAILFTFKGSVFK